jgi:hypothetical protein
MFSCSPNSDAVFQGIDKIKETVRSVNAEPCHGPHSKYDLSMTALKEAYSKWLLSCGLWTPSSMDLVWDCYLCLDVKTQSSQVFEHSIQREILNISR